MGCVQTLDVHLPVMTSAKSERSRPIHHYLHTIMKKLAGSTTSLVVSALINIMALDIATPFRSVSPEDSCTARDAIEELQGRKRCSPVKPSTSGSLRRGPKRSSRPCQQPAQLHSSRLLAALPTIFRPRATRTTTTGTGHVEVHTFGPPRIAC